MFNEITCKKYLRLAIDFDRSDSYNFLYWSLCGWSVFYFTMLSITQDYVASNFKNTWCGSRLWRFSDRCFDEFGWI